MQKIFKSYQYKTSIFIQLQALEGFADIKIFILFIVYAYFIVILRHSAIFKQTFSIFRFPETYLLAHKRRSSCLILSQESEVLKTSLFHLKITTGILIRNFDRKMEKFEGRCTINIFW